jgi:hypothetical protein
MIGPSLERCQRHPDRQADFAVVTHLLLGQWRNMIKADQVLGPICAECRRELLAWMFPERMGGAPDAAGIGSGD